MVRLIETGVSVQRSRRGKAVCVTWRAKTGLCLPECTGRSVKLISRAS
jgi:hypothetical protein